MSNPYYNSSGIPQQSAPGASSAIRGEFAAINAAFDKLPALAGNGLMMIRVNAAGTALEATDQTLGSMSGQNSNSVSITGGSISGVSLTLANPSVFRANAGLGIGSDIQAYSSMLDKLSGLTGPANNLIYFSATDTPALSSLTAYGRTLVAAANAASARSALELVKGISPGNVVAMDPDGKLPAVDGSKLTGIMTTPTVVQVSANTTMTAELHQGRVVETITNNALIHLLPPGASMAPGGEITMISQTIGNTVFPDGSDAIRWGPDLLASLTINPGTVLRFKWTGNQWRVEVNPSRGFIHHYTGGDIMLNRGEICHYDISGINTLMLRIATQDKHIYEIDWGSSVIPPANGDTCSLLINNTNYTNTVSTSFLYTSVDGQAPASNTTTTSSLWLSPEGVGPQYMFSSVVHCKTSLKQILTNFRSRGVARNYMGVTYSISNDTTTQWTSLGSLILGSSAQGRVTVRRIA